jgi:hypothetical protein
MSESINITIEQGATFSQVITPAVVIDLSGYAGTGTIREQADPNYAILGTITVSVAVGVLGIHTLSMTAIETAKIPAHGATKADTSVYVYDVVMTKAQSPTIRQDAGTCTVSPSVTK